MVFIFIKMSWGKEYNVQVNISQISSLLSLIHTHAHMYVGYGFIFFLFLYIIMIKCFLPIPSLQGLGGRRAEGWCREGLETLSGWLGHRWFLWPSAPLTESWAVEPGPWVLRRVTEIGVQCADLVGGRELGHCVLDVGSCSVESRSGGSRDFCGSRLVWRGWMGSPKYLHKVVIFKTDD